MIRLRDAMMLAFAKLHSRRILLSLTIFTSSLLFSILFAGSFIMSGIENSVKTLTDEAHDGHYLVKASPVIPESVYSVSFDPDVKTISQLNSLYKDYIAKAKQLAKEEDAIFDEASIIPPLKPRPYNNPALPASEQLMIDFRSPIYTEYAQERLVKYAQSASNTKEHLKTLASKYDFTNIFSTINAKTDYTNTVYLKDGKEDFDYILKDPVLHGSASAYGFAVSSIQNGTYQMLDDSLLQNWLLPPNARRKVNTNAIPVIITTKEAITLFGKNLDIANEPPTPTEKVQWVRSLQQKINGQKYTSCYRNSADRLQIAQALNDLSEMKANDKKQNYVAPRIVYNLPTEACGALTIKKDDRTVMQKKEDQAHFEMEKGLDADSEPRRGILEFQIVGVIDLGERSFDTPRNVEDFANSLLNNNLNIGALIPRSLYENSGAKATYDTILFGENTKGTQSTDVYTKYGLTESVLTFKNISSARQFIKNEGCSEAVVDCKKLFRLEPYGSNYLLLDDLKTAAINILNMILPITVGIAGTIMFFTMSRVIIDGRRETAVFRALGAKRADIVSVYMVYSLLVSIIISGVSITIGVIAAIVVQALYGEPSTARAHVAYGLFDSSTSFSFIGVYYGPLIIYFGVIIGLGIIATILPLFRNIRRNPITDMREE